MLRIDQARSVDAVAEPVQRQVSALLDRAPRVADALHGRFLHHPAHPAIVAVPLGAFAVSSVVDALTLVGLARGGLRRTAESPAASASPPAALPPPRAWPTGRAAAPVRPAGSGSRTPA